MITRVAPSLNHSRKSGSLDAMKTASCLAKRAISRTNFRDRAESAVPTNDPRPGRTIHRSQIRHRPIQLLFPRVTPGCARS